MTVPRVARQRKSLGRNMRESEMGILIPSEKSTLIGLYNGPRRRAKLTYLHLSTDAVRGSTSAAVDGTRLTTVRLSTGNGASHDPLHHQHVPSPYFCLPQPWKAGGQLRTLTEAQSTAYAQPVAAPIDAHRRPSAHIFARLALPDLA